MRWSIKIARIAGTEIKIHVTFLLLLAWIGAAYYFSSGLAAAVDGIFFILVLFGCVLLHEFGHALAARRYGIPTPDITLLPIGGVARMQRMPDQPRQELVVAIAGPLVNVVIAAVLFVVMGEISGFAQLAHLADPQSGALTKLAWINVALVAFNMLPAFPMDGGRVLRALLAMRMNYARATDIAASIGQGLAFLFGFIGLFFNPLLIFIALFVYLGASQEAALAQLKDLSKGLVVSEAMITTFESLDVDDTVGDAAEAIVRTHQLEFPVIDAGGRVQGILTRKDVLKPLRHGNSKVPVRDIMHTDVPSVHPADNFEMAFRLIQEKDLPALPVVDAAGRLVGLISLETVGEMLMLRASMAGRGGSIDDRPAPYVIETSPEHAPRSTAGVR